MPIISYRKSREAVQDNDQCCSVCLTPLKSNLTTFLSDLKWIALLIRGIAVVVLFPAHTISIFFDSQQSNSK